MDIMTRVAQDMQKRIERELFDAAFGGTTSNVVPLDQNNACTAGKLRAMVQTMEREVARRPPPVRLQMVPSYVWRTYGMWSPGITSADRWRMWCRRAATEDRLEPNPTHDAMPSKYLKMPDFDFLGRVRGEVIMCKGERAYFAARDALQPLEK